MVKALIGLCHPDGCRCSWFLALSSPGDNPQCPALCVICVRPCGSNIISQHWYRQWLCSKWETRWSLYDDVMIWKQEFFVEHRCNFREKNNISAIEILSDHKTKGKMSIKSYKLFPSAVVINQNMIHWHQWCNENLIFNCFYVHQFSLASFCKSWKCNFVCTCDARWWFNGVWIKFTFDLYLCMLYWLPGWRY